MGFIKTLETFKLNLISGADYRKFDGMLKMGLDGTVAQEQRLRDFLESLRQQDKVFYGLHAASEAIVTCIIPTASGGHAILVDGSEGGYAIAAKRLKSQVKRSLERLRVNGESQAHLSTGPAIPPEISL